MPIAKRAALLFLFTLPLSCGRIPVAPLERITISGTVTGRDGQGLEGAHVSFHLLDEARSYAYFSAFTHGSGEYTLDVNAGEYEIAIAGTNGYLPVNAGRFRASRSNNRFDYRFGGIRISGSILGPGGVPLTLARIDLSGAAFGYVAAGDSGYSVIGPAGCYRIRYYPGAQTSGLPTLTLPWVCVDRDTVINVDLSGHEVDGIVLAPNGTPLPHATISGRRKDGLVALFTSGNPDGTYSLQVPTGTYDFKVDSYDSTYIAPHWKESASIVGPQTIDWDLSRVEWSGHVLWFDDKSPVPQAYVSVSESERGGAQTNSDSTGAFRFIVQPGDTYTLRAYAPKGVASIEGLSSESDSTFDILLRRIQP